jgi:protein TonB
MKRSRVTLYDFVPYGAPELLEVGEPYLTRAVTTATLGLVAAFALGLCISAWFTAHPGERTITLDPTFRLEPPPVLDPPPFRIPSLPHVSQPFAGKPIPVPDVQATQDVLIPSQDELRQGSPADATANTGGDVAPIPAVEPVPGVNDYVYYDEPPAVVTRVLPVYPDLAREAGVDGMVSLRVLVGRDGRVKDVRVDRSVPMLDEAAMAAVRQWVFTPALSNGRAVMVWVAVPVRFSLH